MIDETPEAQTIIMAWRPDRDLDLPPGRLLSDVPSTTGQGLAKGSEALKDSGSSTRERNYASWAGSFLTPQGEPYRSGWSSAIQRREEGPGYVPVYVKQTLRHGISLNRAGHVDRWGGFDMCGAAQHLPAPSRVRSGFHV